MPGVYQGPYQEHLGLSHTAAPHFQRPQIGPRIITTDFSAAPNPVLGSLARPSSNSRSRGCTYPLSTPPSTPVSPPAPCWNLLSTSTAANVDPHARAAGPSGDPRMTARTTAAPQYVPTCTTTHPSGPDSALPSGAPGGKNVIGGGKSGGGESPKNGNAGGKQPSGKMAARSPARKRSDAHRYPATNSR